MNEARLRLEPAGTLSVSGPMVLATVTGLWEQARGRLGGLECIDLGEVTQIDSAGLALLLDWLAGGPARPRLTGVPGQLRAIAGVSNLDGVLGLDRPTTQPDPAD